MTPYPVHSRHPEDLSDSEVDALRRVAFALALETTRCWRQVPPPTGTRLAFLQEAVGRWTDLDRAAQRYCVAQAAQFLSDEPSLRSYVPPDGLGDTEWLRFMIAEAGRSDAEIAFLLARAEGPRVRADVQAVCRARQALQLGENGAGDEQDTLDILAGLDRPPLARDFLSNEAWLRRRVLELGRSDGAIARELARLGAACDRSTVRGYRRARRLRRTDCPEP